MSYAVLIGCTAGLTCYSSYGEFLVHGDVHAARRTSRHGARGASCSTSRNEGAAKSASAVCDVIYFELCAL